jgi:hypothetical protein
MLLRGHRSVRQNHAFVACMDYSDAHHNVVISTHITDELNTLYLDVKDSNLP